MYLRKGIKVPQWNLNCLCESLYFFAIILTSTLMIGQAVHCSDSNNNYNSDNYANIHRKIPSSGSGSGMLEKQRSSYAMLSSAMSETINNEFGSKCSIANVEIILRG